MRSLFRRAPAPLDAAALQQPGHPAEASPGQTPASLANPPGLSRRDHAASRSSQPPRRPSPYANGFMSTPPGSQATPASGCRLPSLSPPGARSYPIALNAQIAGFALVNVASSGPARPTTADAMEKPSAESLHVAIPATAHERAELARHHAAQAIRAADAATQPGPAPAAPRKKGLLRSAKRLLSKAEAKVRTRVLGLGVPSAPTVKDVLQVGRPRQEGPPPPKDGTWVRQELQIQQQRTVVEGVGATYHARAGRAALAAVESLHAREDQAGEYLVGDYVDRFAQLHGAYHDAGQALEAALGLVETRQAALAHAGQALAEAAAVREELGACLPPLEAAHRRCEEELQGAREALHAAGTVPELELGLAQARDEHGHLQRLAGEIAARRREIRMQAGPQQKLMGHEAASSRLQLAASGERLARLESDLARARSAQSEVARLEQRAGEAAGHLADAKKDLDNLDLHCQYLKEPQQALQQHQRVPGMGAELRA